jgi:hypothetical protein
VYDDLEIVFGGRESIQVKDQIENLTKDVVDRKKKILDQELSRST